MRDAVSVGVTAPAGFRASGVACGIEPGGLPDLALVAADREVPAAAVFTTNRAAAAPVRVSRRHLAGGRARAVLLNSGCANAGTGAAGEEAAARSAEETAELLGCRPGLVLVCSTGPIGPSLPLDRLVAGLPEAVAALSDGREGGGRAARAILTTDSVPKEAARRQHGWTVGGMAKGAGMIRPDLATLLAVLTTDARADAPRLDRALRAGVEDSFQALDLDGCLSTNDTVVLLASGVSGVEPEEGELEEAVAGVCRDLAHMVARDAEGATRVVTLVVSGARDRATARALGRAVADSDLVRASFHGGDPNWGRILAALGASGLPFDPDRLAVAYQGRPVARAGGAVNHGETELLEAMAGGDLLVEVQVGEGPGRAEVLTVDLTPDYVRFNAARS